MDTISIILVNYNTPEEIKNCLRSIEKIETGNFKFSTIIVDNGSKEPLSLSKRHLGASAEIIRSESNLGFSGGNNLGIRYALEKYNSDYVLLLNSDTEVEPSFLKKMHAYAESDPKIGLVNPKIYFMSGDEFHQDSYNQKQKGQVFWFGGSAIDWSHCVAHHRGVDEVDRGQFDITSPQPFVTGCCLLIKRQVLEQVGFLNEDLFLYWEDVEYSLRARSHGFGCYYYPEAVIWHENAGSSDGAGAPTSRYYQTRNRIWMGWMYGDRVGKKAAARLAVQNLLSSGTVEQKAALDAITLQMGKRAVI